VIVVKRRQCHLNYLQSYPNLVNVKRYLGIVIRYPLSVNGGLAAKICGFRLVTGKYLLKKTIA
jgi:hypothetical protein